MLRAWSDGCDMSHNIPISGVTLTSAKERHYAYLSSRMDALATTLKHTQHYMNIASEQAAYMKELGVGQAAMCVL